MCRLFQQNLHGLNGVAGKQVWRSIFIKLPQNRRTMMGMMNGQIWIIIYTICQ
jgi:hypothetical protein